MCSCRRRRRPRSRRGRRLAAPSRPAGEEGAWGRAGMKKTCSFSSKQSTCSPLEPMPGQHSGFKQPFMHRMRILMCNDQIGVNRASPFCLCIRWEVIADYMNMHSTSGMKRTAKDVINKAKNLQRLGELKDFLLLLQSMTEHSTGDDCTSPNSKSSFHKKIF